MPAVGHALGGGDSLADTNFEGKRWGPHWQQDYAAHLLCPPKRRQPFPQPWSRAVRRQFAGWRQIVKMGHDQLLTTFRLAQERPHTLAGLRARLAATVALHNFCCWLNHHLARPLLAFADLLDW